MTAALKSQFESCAAAHPTWSDERVVEELCEELLNEADVRPPVDVDVLASVCGIVDIEYGPQPWAGMLIPKETGLVARVRVSDGYERQRFTVLHEGGHTLLPGFARGRSYRCKGPRTREEQLCDAAAANLLMPRRFFAADVAGARFGFEAVERLAAEYEASVQATAQRFVDFWPRPALLMVFERRHKPAERGREELCEPKLRLEWTRKGGAWPFMKRHKSVDDDSALGRAWFGEYVDETVALDEVFAESVGKLSVSARRYGDAVLGLVERGLRSPEEAP